MYCLLFSLLFAAVLGCILFHCRRKEIICKVQNMDSCAKCSLLNELAAPLGYCFRCDAGFFSSRLDAWQKQAGYTWLYDYMAPRFHMVFDSLPVYFDYRGRTWLIEFWKGQYGISTGAEIGVYHTGALIEEKDYKSAWFSCAGETEMPDCSLLLCHHETDCVYTYGRHWWLTAFLPGCFSVPSSLSIKACIRFPEKEMLQAFVEGLKRAGRPEDSFSVRDLCVCLVFHENPLEKFSLVTRIRRRLSQWQNKLSCRLYLWITRPFSCTADRILYLYYYLPPAFRRLLRLRRFRRNCHKTHLGEADL